MVTAWFALLLAASPASGSIRVDSPIAPRYSCDPRGLPFELSALDGPGGLQQQRSRLGRAVNRFLVAHGQEIGVPRHGWRLIVRDKRHALIGHGRPIRQDMVFEKNNHRWEWIGSGSCRLRAWRDGETAVPWWVADENTIDGTTTKVGVRVQEENCASGKNAAGRIERLWVFYGNKRIVVTYFVKPLTGGQTCQGNPSTPAVLRLEEPVGDRRLIDGATP